MKTINFNKAKAYKFMSKIICFVMIAIAIVNLVSCKEQEETTTFSGYVYLSDGDTLQGAIVEFRVPDFDKGKGYKYFAYATTNRDGYYETKITSTKDFTCEILVESGETTTGKRWNYYNQTINVVSGENNTVNIYLQLY